MTTMFQAVAPKTRKMTQHDFMPTDQTIITWLGNAGAMINARGTLILIDPVLKGFNLPLLIEMPFQPEDIETCDAILITHSDNDHFSKITCQELAPKTKAFHAPHYVAGLISDLCGFSTGHDIHKTFFVNDVQVTLTPVDHAWQNEYPKYKTREFKPEDYCGFWFDTPDGSLWAIGDSRLLPEQLTQTPPDAILFDFSDSAWHIGFENAVTVANTYPDADLILWHWGSVDAPTRKEFNGDPKALAERIVHPERMHALAAGEPFILKRK